MLSNTSLFVDKLMVLHFVACLDAEPLQMNVVASSLTIHNSMPYSQVPTGQVTGTQDRKASMHLVCGMQAWKR